MAKDLLMAVTGFFSDPAAFHALRKIVFPRLLKQRDRGGEIRIWVPGCYSGEEAYSVAITLRECLGTRGNRVPFQMFATDMNDRALAKARAGVYPSSIARVVSRERLRRYFTEVRGGFQINQDIRERCVFSKQNLAKDPPFSNLDLISCRNVLIYHGPVLQQRVLLVLHGVLKPRGLLLLGASESITGFENLFNAVDMTQKVFAKRPAACVAPAAPAPLAKPLTKSESDRQIARLEQELSATKEYMQSVVKDFEAAKEAIIATARRPLLVLDGTLRVLTVNNAFLRTFRVTRKQTVGRLIYDLGNHQWDFPELHLLLENILPVNTHFDEHRVEHTFPKIGRRAVLVHARRLEPADGPAPLILLAIEDVTEQERAEAALRASGERLALAASGTRIGMFDWNMATGKMLWTEQHAHLLGFPTMATTATTATTFSRKHTYCDWAKRVHPQDLTRVEAELRRCMSKHLPYETEYRVVWPDKSVHWIASRGVFPDEAQGKPRRMLGIIMDITDRKGAEQQLMELNATLEHRVAERTEKLTDANERLHAVMDTAVVGILTLDQRGIVVALNPAAARIFGCSPEELVGRNISRLMASPDQAENEDFLAHYLHARDTQVTGVRNEVLGRCKDGRGIMLELSLSEFSDRGKRQFIALLRDMTVRKRLERELLEVGERERQRIGHDLHDGLGQQLHGVSYLAALLEKDLRKETSPRAAEAGQLKKYLDEALEMNRNVVNGLQPVKPVPEGLMIALRELAGRTQGLYRIDCRFDCRSPVLISEQSAATHLYRIAQEAVNNAVKHGKPTRVRIKLASTRQGIILGVRDNGVGIRRKMGRDGGMGLHIMQYRADALSGSLTIQQHPRGGTVVVCTVTRQALLPQENHFR